MRTAKIGHIDEIPSHGGAAHEAGGDDGEYESPDDNINRAAGHRFRSVRNASTVRANPSSTLMIGRQFRRIWAGFGSTTSELHNRLISAPSPNKLAAPCKIRGEKANRRSGRCISRAN